MRLIDADAYQYPGDLINEPTVDAVPVILTEAQIENLIDFIERKLLEEISDRARAGFHPGDMNLIENIILTKHVLEKAVGRYVDG